MLGLAADATLAVLPPLESPGGAVRCWWVSDCAERYRHWDVHWRGFGPGPAMA